MFGSTILETAVKKKKKKNQKHTTNMESKKVMHSIPLIGCSFLAPIHVKASLYSLYRYFRTQGTVTYRCWVTQID